MTALAIALLRATHTQLLEIPASKRLEALKSEVMDTGGRWDLPSERIGDYTPFLMEIHCHGISGFGRDLDELPANWMRAAGNVLALADKPGAKTGAAA